MSGAGDGRPRATQTRAWEVEMSRDALGGKWPQRRLDRRFEKVAKAVGGGYCRLQMPWSLALGVRETVAGLCALEGRKQVNKALHTCTSWYAYAAMFGSSIDTMVPRALQRMYRLH